MMRRSAILVLSLVVVLALPTALYAEDTNPPEPNPMTWSTEPHATGLNTIEMEATNATDPEENRVEYYFEETTGNSGSDDSGWQDSTNYEDSDLVTDIQYCYRVKARDKSDNQNETDWSEEVCLATGLETTLPAGWNLFSPPGIPVNPDPATSLGDNINDLTLFYDYTPGKGYTTYPDTETQLSWEEGYWVNVNSETPVDMSTNVQTGEQTMEFTNEGWHMIGIPYNVDWSQVSFSDPTDFQTDGAGQVRLVSWSPADETYYNHYSDSSYVLSPWDGFWVKVENTPASITVNETSASASSLDKASSLPQSVDPDELDYPPKPPAYNETDTGLQLLASPNPVSNIQKVVFKAIGPTEGVEKIRTEVFNPNGSAVWEGGAQGTTLSWNPEGIANGIYLYTSSVKVDGKWKKLGVAKLLIIR